MLECTITRDRFGNYVITSEVEEMRYMFFTKREAKSRYYNDFVKPLHIRHVWIENL